jgi:hypothetical protein
MAFSVPFTQSSTSDFCTLWAYMYPLSYVGYMKSNIFQKSQNKAKIGQKSQNFQKKTKKDKFAKKAKIIQNLAFLSNFGFFGNFWIFWEILDFLEQVCCLSFRRLHKDYIDREYMTQSR